MRDRLQELKAKLAEIDQREEDYEGHNAEVRRHYIIQAAAEAADELIMEGTTGDPEETDYLTSGVAQVMNNRVHQINLTRLMRKELLDRIKQ